jgi:hypothetical protein
MEPVDFGAVWRACHKTARKERAAESGLAGRYAAGREGRAQTATGCRDGCVVEADVRVGQRTRLQKRRRVRRRRMQWQSSGCEVRFDGGRFDIASRTSLDDAMAVPHSMSIDALLSES